MGSKLQFQGESRACHPQLLYTPLTSLFCFGHALSPYLKLIWWLYIAFKSKPYVPGKYVRGSFFSIWMCSKHEKGLYFCCFPPSENHLYLIRIGSLIGCHYQSRHLFVLHTMNALNAFSPSRLQLSAILISKFQHLSQMLKSRLCYHLRPNHLIKYQAFRFNSLPPHVISTSLGHPPPAILSVMVICINARSTFLHTT